MSMGQVLYQLPADLIVEEERPGDAHNDQRTASQQGEDYPGDARH